MKEDVLLREIHEAVAEYERLIGGYASYTHQMLDRLGPVVAVSKLVSDSKIQKGLKTLARANRLDLSFEAVVIRHSQYFSRSVVEAAQWRLEKAKQGDFS